MKKLTAYVSSFLLSVSTAFSQVGTGGSPKDTGGSGDSTTLIIAIVAGVVVLIGVGYFLRSRQKQS